MACPDREKDARIIAEVQRRRAMKAKESEHPEPACMYHELEGSLDQVVFMLPEPDKVISIVKVCDGKYLVKLEL